MSGAVFIAAYCNAGSYLDQSYSYPSQRQWNIVSPNIETIKVEKMRVEYVYHRQNALIFEPLPSVCQEAIAPRSPVVNAGYNNYRGVNQLHGNYRAGYNSNRGNVYNRPYSTDYNNYRVGRPNRNISYDTMYYSKANYRMAVGPRNRWRY
jgi:hypothetical protein